MLKNIIGLFLIIFLISACSTTQESRIYLEFENLFPDNAKIVQLIIYKRGTTSEKAQAVFTKQDHVKASLLSELGHEFLTFEVVGDKVTMNSKVPTIKMEQLNKVISEILAVYTEKPVLYLDNGEGLEIVDNGLERIIKRKGKKIITVNYDHEDKWKSNIRYFNHDLQYELNIKPLTVTYENISK